MTQYRGERSRSNGNVTLIICSEPERNASSPCCEIFLEYNNWLNWFRNALNHFYQGVARELLRIIVLKKIKEIMRLNRFQQIPKIIFFTAITEYNSYEINFNNRMLTFLLLRLENTILQNKSSKKLLLLWNIGFEVASS